jgi:hypothetical protein
MVQATKEVGTTDVGTAKLAGLGYPPFDPTAVGRVFQAGDKLLEGWAGVNMELLQFGRAQVDHGGEARKAILESRSATEALTRQAEFTSSFVQEYFTEASKIGKIGARAVLESLKILESAARSAAEETETKTVP